MPEYTVTCKVVRVLSNIECCPGRASTRLGDSWEIGERTPEPKGMCCRAFHTVFPLAFAMRYTDNLPWEGGEGFAEVTCPEGFTVFRLTRNR